MAWTKVASASGAGIRSCGINIDPGVSIQEGDLLVCYGHCNNGDPPANPFDDAINGNWGSNYVLIDSISGSSGRLYVGWYLNSAPATGLGVTVQGRFTATRTKGIVEVWRSDVGGANTLVSTSTGSDGGTPGTTADSGLAPTAAAAGDLLLGGFINSDGGLSYAAGSDGALNNYTADLTVDGYLFAEYLLSATAGTKKATATTSSTGWAAAVLIFRNALSGGGGGSVQPAPPVVSRLGPVTSSLGTTYTAAQILALIFGPSLEMRWYFDLLAPDLVYKDDLTPLLDADQPPYIEHDKDRAVHRNLHLRMRASSRADLFRDLVRVRYQVRAADGGWLEWPAGTFMLTPPDREIGESMTWWSMTCPDLSQLLSDATLGVTTTIPAGADYVRAAGSLVQLYGGPVPLRVSIPSLGATLPADLVWDAKTSFLAVINDLLEAITFVPLAMRGVTGFSRPQPDYNESQPDFVFDAVAGQALVFGPMRETTDYMSAYNQIAVIGQDPRRQPIEPPIYENRRPDSPISLVRWHPRMKVITDNKIASEEAARARQRTEAQAAARIYSALSVGIVPFPWLDDRDVISFTYTARDEGTVSRKYLASTWRHTCSERVLTTLSLQRLVAA